MLKAAILLPKEYDNTLEFYPFLCALSESAQYEEIHILTVNELDCFSALPLNIKVHILKEDDFGLMKNYKVVYKLKDVFNIESFYSFRNDFRTLSMGRAIKAKRRLAFRNPLSFLFYNKSHHNMESHVRDNPYLKLLELDSEMSYEDYKIEHKHSDKGYYIIACDDLSLDDSYHQILNKFMSEMKDKNIFLWSKDHNEVHEALVSDFPFLNFVKDVDDKFLREARGILTNHEYLGHLSRFHGQDHILWSNDLKKIQHYDHFNRPLSMMSLNELGQGVFLSGSEEDTIGELEKALDIILRTFRL